MDRLIEKKKWPLKKILLYSAAGVFVLFIFYVMVFGDHSRKLNVQTERLTVAVVERRPFQEYIPITGTVIPIRTAYIDAQERGMVSEIYLESGSMVETGDVILELENSNLRLEIMNQEAALLEQRNQLRNTQLQMERQQLNLKNQLIDFDYRINRAKREYEQNKDLLKNKIISRKAYLESRETYEYQIKKRALAIESYKQDSLIYSMQLEQLSGSLFRLQANLDIVKQRLDHLSITAPVTGQLTSLNVEYSGEIVSSGERLGQIDILDGFKIRAGVDEHYLPRVRIGQQGSFEFADKGYDLNIFKVFPEIVDGQFNIDLKFEDASPSRMRRGQTVHIRLELGGLEDALTLMRGGFYQKTGGQWVFVVDKSGDFATKRKIRLGRQNTDVFEVLEGLQVGESVIVSSYDNYGDVEKLMLK